jgi:hypothetical protein
MKRDLMIISRTDWWKYEYNYNSNKATGESTWHCNTLSSHCLLGFLPDRIAILPKMRCILFVFHIYIYLRAIIDLFINFCICLYYYACICLYVHIFIYLYIYNICNINIYIYINLSIIYSIYRSISMCKFKKKTPLTQLGSIMFNHNTTLS